MSEMGQTEKDQDGRDTAGQPRTTELFGEKPTKPVCRYLSLYEHSHGRYVTFQMPRSRFRGGCSPKSFL